MTPYVRGWHDAIAAVRARLVHAQLHKAERFVGALNLTPDVCEHCGVPNTSTAPCGWGGCPLGNDL